MRLFEDKDKLRSYIIQAKLNGHYIEKELEDINLSYYKAVFANDNILGEIIVDVADKGYDLEETLNKISVIYMDIVKSDSKEEITTFKNIYNILRNVSPTGYTTYDTKIYDLLSPAFDDKSLVLEAIINIKNILNLDNFEVYNEQNLEKLLKYPSLVRQYFLYDRLSFSDFVNLLYEDGIKDCLFNDVDIDTILDRKVINAKKHANIYDVDQGIIAEFSKRVESMEQLRKDLVEVINASSTILGEIAKEKKEAILDIKNTKINQLRELETKVLELRTNFNQMWNELISEQKEDLNGEKELIKADIRMYAEKIKNEFNSAINKIQTEYNIKLSKAEINAKNIIDSLKEDERLKDIIENTAFIEGIKKIGTSKEQLSIDSKVNDGVILSAPSIIMPVTEEDRKIDDTVNFYLDNSIPLKVRLEKLQEVKALLESQGEIFNEAFLKVIKELMIGRIPYLWGQSGCGKTYMMEEQIPRILKMKIVKQGYIEYDQDVLGYNNAGTGAYVASNFYRSYKYGNLISFDEIDNGRANATVVLNRFDGDSFIFPNGEEVKKHPNFRIITSGNTKGAGKDKLYNTREKLDEATLQRLTPIEINFDNRLDNKILINYPAWYEFAIEFRKVVLEKGMPGVFTTRDSVAVKTKLDEEVFSDEEIFAAHFIQTKTKDELLSIVKAIQNEDKISNNKILTKFKSSLIKKGINI